MVLRVKALLIGLLGALFQEQPASDRQMGSKNQARKLVRDVWNNKPEKCPNVASNWSLQRQHCLTER
jgi:hypothetical protein